MKAIVAMAENRVIGNAGGIPWHFREDLQFFKRTTLGHAVVMGRKTFESIGKPLPGRENFVLSSGPDIEGVTMLRSPGEVPRSLTDGCEIFVIGGAGVYDLLVPECDELFLTLVRLRPEGDTIFPPFEEDFDAMEVLSTGPDLEFRRYFRTTRSA